ncbi:MAG TPA: hypothetical protein EYH01_10885 [Campylobacterales bacterium]|nr:hypothetical protein [Campylobacterales bacterium]HIP60918.1 hypothetical protein [Campylobacterales bacterium]
MGFKKYVVFGLILLIVMGVIVYSFIGDNYSFPFAGITITLPIAVWVIFPALILFLFTIAHLVFFGALGFARMRKIRKDGEKLLENSKNALLGRVVNNEYKTDMFKLPGTILPLLNIDPKRYADYRVYDDGIQDILDAKRKVYSGEVVDLSSFSLRADNALVLKNHDNRLAVDKSYADTILKKCDDKTLCQKAHLAMASYASMDDLNKYDVEPTRELFDTLVERVNAKENPLDFSDDVMVDYIKKLNFSHDDFIALAKNLKTKMNPDRLMLLFERLAHEFPADAGEGYLYVMFELQMMDHVRDFLENSTEDEYKKCKYMLFLKDSGKNFDTELFI